MKNLNEIDIIIQFKNNNFENFKYIYDKYYMRVVSIISKKISDYYLIEDIVQEVFFEVFLNIFKLRKVKSFYNWLIKIAINKINYNLKKIINLKNSEVLMNEYKIYYEEYFDENLENKYLAEILQSKIITLPEDKRNVINQYFYQKLSIKEISKLQNSPIGTVKSRLYYSKKEIKEYLIIKVFNCSSGCYF
ncbi:putative RNA polymerase sigma-W factor [Clostridium perfringens D str. JGS1721]|uniref:Putative RNA polymerase sigma-W factor n=1 Tax=Clostridium perfringens D str. JGS1721 TaxID=488537 RepID=B1V644_CLOPF|nr:RNA polymerase sigma factor [Clostridium perfringens]EDT70728.1 putative RNA polymerase sigma-W factor [Clostridium perfringens D str. JGS1721]